MRKRTGRCGHRPLQIYLSMKGKTTPLPCRASPLKRRQFRKASSFRGGGKPQAWRRSLRFSGEQCSPLQICVANAIIITSTACTRDSQKSSVIGTGKGKQRRLQAPGGQRGKRAIPPDGLNKFSLGQCFPERRGDVACYPWASLPSPFPLGDGLGIAPYRFTFS